jgi:hypothetical protein
MLRNYPNFHVIAMFAMEGDLGHEKWYVDTFIDLGVTLLCATSNLVM